MSSIKDESTFKRRTSERRRLKLLKQTDEFRMPNPYKLQQADSPFPHSLSRQLTKIDFLSASSIALLALDPNCLPPCPHSALHNMQTALREQQERYGRLFGGAQMQEKEKEDSCWSPKQQNCMQLMHTGEISLNLYDPEVKDELLGGSAQLGGVRAMEWGGCLLREPSAMLLEDYENYFIN